MARNPLRIDPSRTMMDRRAFQGELRRRFAKLAGVVRAEVTSGEWLTANAAAFKFDTDDTKLKKFNSWLKKQIDDKVLQVNPMTGEPLGQKPWFYRYIDSAYRKAAIKAYTSTARSAPAATKGFINDSFNQPERVSKLRLLYTRTYEDLKGITSATSAKLSRTLADGIAHGQHPKQIAATMAKNIKSITKQRADLLAQTEIMHAHAEGQLDAFEDVGVEEVGAEVEFSTAGDDGVCPICRALEGKRYTIKQARGVIPLHPRCRCTWLPYIRVPKMNKSKRVVK